MSVEGRLADLEVDVRGLQGKIDRYGSELAQLAQTIRTPGHWWEELRLLREEVRDLRGRLDGLAGLDAQLATVATRQESIREVLGRMETSLQAIEERSDDAPPRRKRSRKEAAAELWQDTRAQVVAGGLAFLTAAIGLMQAATAALVWWVSQ